MSRCWLPALILLLSILEGCSGPTQATAIGEAFVGPATLKLRQDLGPRSAEAATVHHGERVEIVQRRRRFVKVRSEKGAEGWTDMRQLLASEQMAALDQLAERAVKMRSQGAATVYEGLNVHTEPNRQAPSFYRIREGEAVDVVDHQLAPRIPFDPPSVLPERPKVVRPRKPKKAEQEARRIPPPPAPKLPDNWLELSKTPPMPELEPPPEPVPAKPIPNDDWSLIRLKSGRAGWVLTGMLRMNIPDEVAQYSEGHRITSYFPMADVNDNGQIKHHWLWTTLSKTGQAYQFDSFRYFIWNLRRHRYETAYVERNLKGYFPVEVHPVQVMTGKKLETYPGFSLILEDEGGTRYRKTYAYQIYLVKLVEKTKIEPPPQEKTGDPAAPQEVKPAPAPEQPLYKRLMRNAADLRQRWFGKK